MSFNRLNKQETIHITQLYKTSNHSIWIYTQDIYHHSTHLEQPPPEPHFMELQETQRVIPIFHNSQLQVHSTTQYDTILRFPQCIQYATTTTIHNKVRYIYIIRLHSRFHCYNGYKIPKTQRYRYNSHKDKATMHFPYATFTTTISQVLRFHLTHKILLHRVIGKNWHKVTGHSGDPAIDKARTG